MFSHQPSFKGAVHRDRVQDHSRPRREAQGRPQGAAPSCCRPKPDPKALAKLGDDRILAEMTKRVFSAGFAWSVIETKWPGFEKAFLGFKPGPLSLQPDEFWDALMKDTRIVRNGAKIMSVRANAGFVRDIAKEHGSFGKFLANWPSSDEAGLLELLAKRGSRLGGNTGQMMLRFLGWDGFVTSRDVVLCLRDAGLDIAGDRHLEARPRQGAGAVQRLGRGDRPSLRAALADLRAVDRRELCGREAGEHDGRRRLIRLRSASYGATSPTPDRRHHMTKNPCVASRRSCSTRPYSQSR